MLRNHLSAAYYFAYFQSELCVQAYFHDVQYFNYSLRACRLSLLSDPPDSQLLNEPQGPSNRGHLIYIFLIDRFCHYFSCDDLANAANAGENLYGGSASINKRIPGANQ